MSTCPASLIPKLRSAVVLSVTVTACALFRPPLSSLEEGGDGWNELTTEHFVLYTDVSPGDHVVLGNPVPQCTEVPPWLLPTAFDITHADRSRFTPRDADMVTAARYYAGAWILVHMLRNGPERYRERFGVFASALNAGESADKAWGHALAGLDEGTLQRDFMAYARTSVWTLVERNTPARSWPSTIRSMRPAEVHLLWARVAPGSPDGRSVAKKQIALADQLGTDSAEVAYVEGCLATALEQYSDASTAFRTAVTLSPHEPRYLFGLALSLSTEPRGPSEHAQEIARTYTDLMAVAKSPEQGALVAGFLMATSHPDDALEQAARAVRRDRRCSLCARVLARILVERGDVPAGIAVIEQALSASPDSPQDRALLEALEMYRRAPHPKDK
jgi:Flp pilus assembly protein TadD